MSVVSHLTFIWKYDFLQTTEGPGGGFFPFMQWGVAIKPQIIFTFRTHLNVLSPEGHKVFCVPWKCQHSDPSPRMAVEQCMDRNAGMWLQTRLWVNTKQTHKEHGNVHVKLRATQSRSPILLLCCLAPGLLLQSNVGLHWHTYLRWGGSDP